MLPLFFGNEESSLLLGRTWIKALKIQRSKSRIRTLCSWRRQSVRAFKGATVCVCFVVDYGTRGRHCASRDLGLNNASCKVSQFCSWLCLCGASVWHPSWGGLSWHGWLGKVNRHWHMLAEASQTKLRLHNWKCIFLFYRVVHSHQCLWGQKLWIATSSNPLVCPGEKKENSSPLGIMFSTYKHKLQRKTTARNSLMRKLWVVVHFHRFKTMSLPQQNSQAWLGVSIFPINS